MGCAALSSFARSRGVESSAPVGRDAELSAHESGFDLSAPVLPLGAVRLHVDGGQVVDHLEARIPPQVVHARQVHQEVELELLVVPEPGHRLDDALHHWA